MKRRAIKQKDVIIPFCEGEAEIILFGFLKLQYSNKKIEFRKPKDISGFENLDQFKKKYNKLCKEQDLKPRKDFSSVKFLFLFDNDLADSKRIKEFLEKEEHLVQQSEPNAEGLMLSLIGKSQGNNLKTKGFRKKCKHNFKKHFGCAAHHLKDKKLKEIFSSEEAFKKKLPILHGLFKG